MANIHQEIVFEATPERVYEALMSDEKHSAFTGGPAEISRQPGGAFSCYGGQVVGRYIDLVPNERIVQAWRVGAWDDGVFSLVTLRLHAQGSETRVVMEQAGVPDAHREHIDSGWHARYWEPLRKYLS